MKALLLNSGGIDTLAVARILTSKGHELHSLYLDLGQLNTEAASGAATKIAEAYCRSHAQLDVGGLVTEDPSFPAGVGIPFQNELVFVLGASYAHHLGLKYIASGLKGDTSGTSFNKRLMDFLRGNPITDMKVPVRPLAKMGFAEIYELVKDDHLLGQTVSCNRFPPPCGKCVKCRDRKEFGINE